MPVNEDLSNTNDATSEVSVSGRNGPTSSLGISTIHELFVKVGDQG